MKTEYKDCDGTPIREGDIVMLIKPKKNKFGRYYCRAYHIVRPRSPLCKRHPLVAKHRGADYETLVPLPQPDSRLTVIGTVAEGVDHAKSKALWDEAKQRTESETA